MAINFGDGSVQSFSGKIIQKKRALRPTQLTTSSNSYTAVTSITFTPKSSSSIIHAEFTGCCYVQQEPGGIRAQMYDFTDSNRFGTSLSNEDPLLLRFDMQSLSNGYIYSYAGAVWRAQESSWGTTAKIVGLRILRAGNGTVGFITEYLPATLTLTEVME